MTSTSSPWSRDAPSSVTLPPPASPPPALPPPGAPTAAGFRPAGPRGWLWVRAVVGLALVVAVSAAVGFAVTYIVMRNHHAASTSTSASTVSPSPSAVAPRFSASEVASAKQNLCQVFDVSVRGQQGQGGFRQDGNLNIPLTLRAVNSASAVQNALVPAVPPDVASAARRYISTTLDVTTAAMGNTPTAEVNRLTDVDADAIYALTDACGLPR